MDHLYGWIWWGVLALITLVNVVVWLWIYFKSHSSYDKKTLAKIRNLEWYWLVFVIGCGIRSFYPNDYQTRICFIDAWISKTTVSRAVATVAEVCMAHVEGLNVYWGPMNF